VLQQYNEIRYMAVTMWGFKHKFVLLIQAGSVAVQRDALHGCDNVGVCTVNTGLGVSQQYSEYATVHGCDNVGVCTVITGLGVSQQYNEMHLLPEPLFSVTTDGVHIMSIEATQHGRILMAGKDGCLYELAYQVCMISNVL